MDGAAEHVEVADRAALHEWFTARHEQRDGVWIVFLKGAQRTMAYDDIVEEALSFGWDAFPRSATRAILEWISAAKRPETRAKRIRQTVDEAAENRRANEWRPKS